MQQRDSKNNPIIPLDPNYEAVRLDNTLVICNHFCDLWDSATKDEIAIGSVDAEPAVVVSFTSALGKRVGYKIDLSRLVLQLMAQHREANIPRMRPVTTADAEVEAELVEPTEQELLDAQATIQSPIQG